MKKYAVIPALLADDGQYGSYAEEEQTGQKRIYEIGSTLERLGIVHENKNRPKREWLLNRVRHIDDDVAEALYSTNRSVPTQEQLQRSYSRPQLYSRMAFDSRRLASGVAEKPEDYWAERGYSYYDGIQVVVKSAEPGGGGL